MKVKCTTEYNIFGDVAGRYDELQLLLDRMPSKAIPVSVGDMADRGPKSKDVWDFFRNKGLAVLGNHEHLFVDYYEDNKYYESGMWFLNGGVETLLSFINDKTVCSPHLADLINFVNSFYRTQNYWDMYTAEIFRGIIENIRPFVKDLIPEEYVMWLKGLYLSIESNDFIITHAALDPSIPIAECYNLGQHTNSIRHLTCCIWNRGETRRKEQFQIHGHTAQKNVTFLSDYKGDYGINLDSSKGDKLTGMHWPSREIFVQDYLS